jgi:DNA-binding CsgD family transcriptional regulator
MFQQDDATQSRAFDQRAEGDRSLQKKLPIVILILSVGTVVDLVLDSPTTLWSAHVLFELLLMLFGLGAAGYFWFRWRDTDTALLASRAELAEQTAERDAWRGRAEKLLRGLGVEIDVQFRIWGLTAAESDTALMILKGYEHKQIAAIQQKSERTVRQHARAIYRKSGLASRAELSAFFLEDLLLPNEIIPHEGEAVRQTA